MNSRLQALVDRGYSKEEVLELAQFSDEELDYACEVAFKRATVGCAKTSNSMIVYIGGQPGSGKTVLSMEMKESMPDYVEIGIDNYRMYHPRYLKIEECIRKHWKNRKESINDSPGNDIADFTHLFAGAMSDRLTKMASKKDENGESYNILMEWGMREPNGPLNSMKEMKELGYNSVVLFVAVSSHVSYMACNLRAELMKSGKRIFRKVPKSFHDYAVSTLPESIDKIYEEGYCSGIVTHMAIVSRDGKVLWDVNQKTSPGKTYEECLNQNMEKTYNDYAKAYDGNKKEMLGLFDEKEKLKYIRDSIIYMAPYFVSNDSKKRI